MGMTLKSETVATKWKAVYASDVSIDGHPRQYSNFSME
jgi:hypothetical protein